MNLPEKISKMSLDEKSNHYYIPAADDIWYFGERTSRKDYKFSDCNNFISNLKKPVKYRGKPHYQYKTRAKNLAIRRIIGAIEQITKGSRCPVIVPIPPSKAKDHEDYDPRLLEIAEAVAGRTNIHFGELIIQTVSMAAAHECETRITIDELVDAYQFNFASIENIPCDPDLIILFDDVVTAGNHYTAAKTVIRSKLGTDIKISGLFLAKTVRDNEVDFSEFDFEDLL